MSAGRGNADPASRRRERVPRERNLKVLLVSNQHPELVRGGGQQACYELFHALKGERDVEPYFLAATDSSSPALGQPGACITGFDGRQNEFLFLSAHYDDRWLRTPSARHTEAFAGLLETIRPDVVHFQHFVRLGIDFLSLTRRVLTDCRIVLTLHDYLPICAARGQMVRLTDGSLCSRPSAFRCHQCLPGRPPDQYLLRKMWFLRHLSVVDRYACAARFQIEYYAAWGIDRGRIFHVRNGQPNYAPATLPPPPPGPKNRLGFFGQMTDNKGVQIIFGAVRILRSQGFTDFTIELNGDNIQFASPAIRREIEVFLAEEEQRPPAQRNVFNNGSYQADQIAARMLRVDWTLVASLWREGSPLVISEARMFKRPVICSNVGAMAEVVGHEVDGLHFQVGDSRALAAAIHRACVEPGLWERLSAAAPDPPSLAEGVKGYRALYE